MNRPLQTAKYLTSDFLAAAVAWTVFFVFRKRIIESEFFGQEMNFLADHKFFLSLFLITLFWLFIYTITGTYENIYRKSRLKELGQTLLISIIGCTILFFTVILDDIIVSYKNYYQSFGVLLGTHFILTATGRIILSSITAYRIHNRILGFNTLMIGSNENALRLYRELEGMSKSSGFFFKGFVHINGGQNHALDNVLPHLGHFREIEDVVREHEIEDAIIALESNEHDKIGQILNKLEGTGVNVKIIPKMYDILSGQVKMSSIFGAPLIDINSQIMPVWQRYVKRIFDIIVSLICLLALSPLYIILGLLVVLTSKGPAIYSHQRIGLQGKPFTIYKFRSMYKNAETNGPALSSEDDKRITPLGKFLRRSRLDELPQFWNVLKGDMSIVGPRPERQYFINQIMQEAPHYRFLHKVRPGITSWGQVKFGYAENVDQMIERLKFDVLYIENMSLFVDFKILIYTILIVLQGRGK